MRQLHPRRFAAILAAAAVLTTAGCSGDGERDDGGTDTPSAYQQALEHLPSSVATFEFRDVATTEQRLGTDDETDADAYLKASAESSWGVSSLTEHLAAGETPWTATDVEWEVQIGDPGPMTIRALADDVDLEAAIGELEDAGYTSESHDDGTLLTADMDDFESDDVRTYLELGMAILVLPDEHLVVSSIDSERIAAYTDSEETLADAGTLDRLVDGESMDIEYVFAQVGPQPCDPAGLLGPEVSPEAAKRAVQKSADLGTPIAATLAVGAIDDTLKASAHLRFGDEEAAGADVDPRTDVLEDGTSLVTNEPYSDYFTVDDISVDGDVETIVMEPDTSPNQVLSMVMQRDAPFLMCVLSS